MHVRPLLVVGLLCALPLLAQERQHEQMPMPMPEKQQQKPGMKAPQMPGMKMSEQKPAPAQFASGTSWEPLSSPMHMLMWSRRAWQIDAHGNAFLTFNDQGGPRGAGKLESMNWAMLMESHPLGPGTITFRQMLSAEPLTAPHPGFPQIFQTGETYNGRALVDHQHPHDVFSEMAAMFTVPLHEKVTWLIYGGPAGEPALGPTAFPHRAAAAELPAAPLSHHVQDSTHISFGVVTTGFILGPVKLEGSAFNGREPDEQRWDFDLGPLDSWAFRAAVAPGRNWTAQYSLGRLHHPEALEPGDVDRQTASVSYSRPLANGYWVSTLVWGRNHKRLEATNQNSYLLDSTVNFRTKNYAYTRLELVDKDELFPESPPPHAQYRIGAFTFGGVRDLAQTAHWRLGLGADVTFYSKPSALDPIYGNSPVSVRVFLRVRPALMKH